MEDYKSGAYLKYSKDFRDLTELSRENSGIRRDLEILASRDKEAIFNLQFSAGLGRAIAMMWNNGENIVNVSNIANQANNAHNHGLNMREQQEQQDELIPPSRTQGS